MAGNEDVTIGEVYRLVLEIRKDMREQGKDYLPFKLYASERDAMREDIKELGTEIGELRTALELERNERIKSEQAREKADLENEQKQNRAASERRLQWTLAIVGPIVAMMISLVGTAASLGLFHTTP